MAASHRLVVLGAGGVVPELGRFHHAAAWYHEISAGAVRLDVRGLAPVDVPVGHHSVHGGLAPRPPNAPSFVEQVLRASGVDGLDAAPVVVAPGFRPHTWRLGCGGWRDGSGRWWRRYALVPPRSSLGTLCHEVGHLLFDWPDHRPGDRLGEVCLMGRGGRRDGGADPAPPSLPLRLAAGWMVARPWRTTTSLDQLATPHVWVDGSVELAGIVEADQLVVYELQPPRRFASWSLGRLPAGLSPLQVAVGWSASS